MKTIIRLPTEQYAYIEMEIEAASPQAAVEAYKELADAYKPKAGISREEFNAALDQYLIDGTGNTDQFHTMSEKQQFVFQEIKKSNSRVNKQ